MRQTPWRRRRRRWTIAVGALIALFVIPQVFGLWVNTVPGALTEGTLAASDFILASLFGLLAAAFALLSASASGTTRIAAGLSATMAGVLAISNLLLGLGPIVPLRAMAALSTWTGHAYRLFLLASIVALIVDHLARRRERQADEAAEAG